MALINSHFFSGQWRAAGSLRAVPADAFAELAQRKVTEIRVDVRGLSVHRNSYIDRPLKAADWSSEPGVTEGLGEVIGKGDDVVVTIDADLCFRRMLAIPGRAYGKIDDILDLELARITPFSRADVFSSWIDHGPTPEQAAVAVEQVVVRKDYVSDIINEVGRQERNLLGLIVRPGMDAALPMALDIDGNPYAAAERRRWMSLVLASLALLALSVLALGAAISVRHDRITAAIELEAIRVAKEAQEVERRLDTIRQEMSDIAAAENRRITRLPLLAVIEELSRILPDDTFLQSLTIESGNISADGGSKAPERLLQLLEDSSVLKNASFSAPVFRNSGEQWSQFAVVLEIEQPLPSGKP